MRSPSHTDPPELPRTCRKDALEVLAWHGYLRSRGEDSGEFALARLVGGVPPLAQRGRAQFGLSRNEDRGTSARAERTGWREEGRTRPAGYLRSRGEDADRCSWPSRAGGVPPLARRGRRLLLGLDPLPRGTSARAKRTPRGGQHARRTTGYLRSRGEDSSSAVAQRTSSGVPPLARRGLEVEEGQGVADAKQHGEGGFGQVAAGVGRFHAVSWAGVMLRRPQP